MSNGRQTISQSEGFLSPLYQRLAMVPTTAVSEAFVASYSTASTTVSEAFVASYSTTSTAVSEALASYSTTEEALTKQCR